jgi:hypothetical protein
MAAEALISDLPRRAPLTAPGRKPALRPALASRFALRECSWLSSGTA